MSLPNAMSGRGGNMGSTITMDSGNGRAGAPDMGEGQASGLAARELAHQAHFVQPANNTTTRQDALTERARTGMPYYYNQYDGPAVPYAAPSQQKENMVLRAAVREAANEQIRRQGTPSAVQRTDPISDEEVAYLKSMKDQAELAKFDDYVESFIDPRKPGNMKWLMEIYPDYVNRRLQQAHTDYEFALRNQMIDSWGINTFDDLHFKYMVDQGKIDGPQLRVARPTIDSRYAPGWLSPFNFQPDKTGTRLFLPFAKANTGASGRTEANQDGREWSMDRAGRALGNGADERSLAMGMYDVVPQGPGVRTAGPMSNDGAARQFGARVARAAL